MKIQCDVCEKAPATVICCADEAALCAHCDMEVHAANKLASKHQRLLLSSLSTKLPPCDICQEKPAFIFCVEDRALFCQDCDESVHPAGSLSANHQRLLATGIRVALSSSCSQKRALEPPNQDAKSKQQVPVKIPPQPQPQPHEASTFASQWSVDDLLHFPDFDKKEHIEFGELEWMEADMGLFNYQLPQEALTIAEVPQLPPALPHSTSYTSYRPSMSYKKPRIQTIDDDDEFFTVPDLG